MPYKCAKFQLDLIMHLRVMAFVQKEEKKKTEKSQKFAHLYLVNGSWNLLLIWYAVSPSRQAPPQHIWYQSDKRSWS